MYKLTNRKFDFKIFFLAYLSFFFLLVSCTKDTTTAELNLANKFVANKIWYLDYAQTITNGTVIAKNYIGQSTYSVNYLKDLTIKDSDGMNGTYTIEKINGQLQIHVLAKTNGNNTIEYIYNIESIGSSSMVLNYLNGGSTIRQFFSTK